MARQKPKNLIPVKDVAEANKVLAEIASIKRTIQALEGELNDAIDHLKAQSEARAAPYKVRLLALENGLLAFSEFNKDELFFQKRSKVLEFGTIGYRRSMEIKPQPKTTWKMILGKIKDLDFSDALRIREDVNRDELRGWPEERLELVGARRMEKDTFWYETDETTLPIT